MSEKSYICLLQKLPVGKNHVEDLRDIRKLESNVFTVWCFPQTLKMVEQCSHMLPIGSFRMCHYSISVFQKRGATPLTTEDESEKTAKSMIHISK